MKISSKMQIIFIAMLYLSIATNVYADGVGDKKGKNLSNEMSLDWREIYQTNSWLNFDQALMGMQNGAFTTSSGMPGVAGSIMLRGISTVNLNSSPVLNVDGVVYKMNNNMTEFASGMLFYNSIMLNPGDIEKMDFDGSGYKSVNLGGKAANGVLNVSTLKGTLGATGIVFSARLGMQTNSFDGYEMMATPEYKAYLFNSMHEQGASLIDLQKNNMFSLTHKKYNNNTDWMKQIEQDGMFHDYALKIHGGDGDTRYMFGLNYTAQDGTVKNTGYDRFSTRVNLDYKISPKISIINYLSYTFSKSNYYDMGNNWDVNPLYLALTKAPFYSVHYIGEDEIAAARFADSDELGKSNVALLSENLNFRNDNNRIDALVGARWAMDVNSAFSTKLSVTYVNTVETQKRLSYGLVADEDRIRQNSKRTYSDYILRWDTYFEEVGQISENYIYSGKIGFLFEQETEKSIYARRINAGTDDFESLKYGDLDSIGNLDYDHSTINFYANGGMNIYKNIRANVNVNVEASSNFGSKGRWNVYAGAMLGGDIVKNDHMILSATAQWGRSGNNDIRGHYYEKLYYPTSYLGQGGSYLGSIANEKLKPEMTNEYEFAFNFGLSMLKVHAGYYYKKTTGLLTQKDFPIELGLDPQFENNGDVVNHGLELAIDARVLKTNALQWDIFANVSSLNNEVVSLNNGDIVRSFDNVNTIVREGESLGSFYGYKVKGVFNTAAAVNLKRVDGSSYRAGDYIMDDMNEDGIINAKDMQVIGSPLPDFYGGFGTHFSHELGFKLSALFSYSLGNDVYNLFNSKLSGMTDYSLPLAEAKYRWLSETSVGRGYLPRAAVGDPSGNFHSSDRWVEDGSYLKLKSLSLSYDIPLRNRDKFLRGLKVFVNCNNLFTVTSYSGFDPEANASQQPSLRGIDAGSLPNVQSYVLGINISL